MTNKGQQESVKLFLEYVIRVESSLCCRFRSHHQGVVVWWLVSKGRVGLGSGTVLWVTLFVFSKRFANAVNALRVRETLCKCVKRFASAFKR